MPQIQSIPGHLKRFERGALPQSRMGSLVETVVSIAIGFVVSVVITAVVMPWYGHDVTFADNIQITAVFTVASIARGYFVRRWFNWLAGRG